MKRITKSEKESEAKAAMLPDRFACERFDIVPPPNIWPMLRQHLLAKWLNFHLADTAHSRALKAKIKAADARKER